MTENIFDKALISDKEWEKVKISRVNTRPNAKSSYGTGSYTASDTKALFDKQGDLFRLKHNALVNYAREEEADRATAEAQRVAAEKSRAAAEGSVDENSEYYGGRALAEAQRGEAEAERVDGENYRREKETIRNQKEEERVSAETYREERFKKIDNLIGDLGVIGYRDTEVVGDTATALGFETKAGGRGFKIFAVNDNGDGTGNYILLSIPALMGLKVGMRYSVRLSTAGYDLGEIISINGSTVTVNNYVHRDMVDTTENPDDPENCYVSNYLSIVGHPDLGDTVVGFNATAFGENTMATDRDAFAEGRETKAIGQYSHTEGHSTMAGFASHAEGRETNATGEYAHAEGYKTNALGERSHAEGSGTTASGIASHAEGYGTVASKHSSHAEGYQTNATGMFSHAEGANNTASGQQAHAEGENNVASGYASHAEGLQVVASGKIAHAEGEWTEATSEYSHAEGYQTKAHGGRSHAEGSATKASGYVSHAEGSGTTASGTYSHAEGRGTTASGSYSHAEGSGTTASHNYAHVEGINTKSTSSGGHAEGNSTQAGYFAHSEGESTIASGSHSHAEGYQTNASGLRSHAEGQGTVATVEAQHVQGKFNAIDANDSAGNFAHIVGGGTSDTNRKNIHTIDWSGNAFFAGTVKAVAWDGTIIDMTKKIMELESTIESLQDQLEGLVSSALPIEVSTEAEMTALLESGEVGGVYKYVGETTDTCENGALYLLEVGE